jgi:hypothetical protein
MFAWTVVLYAFCVAGMTGVHHHVLVSLRWDLENFLPMLASNCEPPDLCLPSSQDYCHELPALVLSKVKHPDW